MARGADPARLGPLGALPARASHVRREGRRSATASSTAQLLAACASHEPDDAAKALHDHLELASVIFETELAGRGIFER